MGGAKLQVFVVEDNPGDVQLLRMSLEAAHLDSDLTVVNDGREALDYVQQRGIYTETPAPDLAFST